MFQYTLKVLAKKIAQVNICYYPPLTVGFQSLRLHKTSESELIRMH